MTTLARMQTPFLVSTMLIHGQKELYMDEGTACNCYHPTWKSTFHAMAAKMS
jgi:hypothetical protein